MNLHQLDSSQQEILDQLKAREGAFGLMGPAGSKKREILFRLCLHWLENDPNGQGLYIISPDHGHSRRLHRAIDDHVNCAFVQPKITTIYALAHQLNTAAWPSIFEAGLGGEQGDAASPPAILNYETSQALMRDIVEPRARAGQFDGLHLRRSHLVSQLLDSMNKAAVNAYPLDEIAPRLQGSWSAQAGRERHIAVAVECIREFRARCLSSNLVDVSLSLERFAWLITERFERTMELLAPFSHLIVMNAEESIPIARSFFDGQLEHLVHATFGYDLDAGYRTLLGVDPGGMGEFLSERTDLHFLSPSTIPTMDQREDRVRPLHAMANQLTELKSDADEQTAPKQSKLPKHWAVPEIASMAELQETDSIDSNAICILAANQAEMLNLAVDQVRAAHHADKASSIAIVIPYLDGVTQFVLSEDLHAHGYSVRILKRFKPMRDSLAVRCALVILALEGQHKNLEAPSEFEVAEALAFVSPDIDPIRADLLARSLYSRRERRLRTIDALDSRLSARLDADSISAYRSFYEWIYARESDPADSKEPGSTQASVPLSLSDRVSRIVQMLEESAERERDTSRELLGLMSSAIRFEEMAKGLVLDGSSLEKAFIEMVDQGTIAAPSVRDRVGTAPRSATGITDSGSVPGDMSLSSGAGMTSDGREIDPNTSPQPEPEPETEPQDPSQAQSAMHSTDGFESRPEILIATAHSYLAEGLEHDQQIWLNVDSEDWISPPHQALTNPWVLSHRWPASREWTAEISEKIAENELIDLCAGLLRRTNQELILLGRMGEAASLDQSPLLRLLDRAIQPASLYITSQDSIDA